MNQPLSIKTIHQKDNHVFTVVWHDDVVQHFRLSDLQKNCPCASCFDEQTGRPKANLHSVNEDVKAINIRSVGRYALQIKFTSGCSTGIYSYNRLRDMKRE